MTTTPAAAEKNLPPGGANAVRLMDRHDLKVRKLRVTSVKRDEGNPRTHGAAQIGQVVKSIETFGFTNPILIDEASVIIAGHGRYEAALQLGFDKVPTIRLAGLTAAEREALNIADNQLALNSGWSRDKLSARLSSIKGASKGLVATTGFSADRVKALSVKRKARSTNGTGQRRFSFVVEADQASVIDDAIDKAGGETASAALVAICQAYNDLDEADD